MKAYLLAATVALLAASATQAQSRHAAQTPAPPPAGLAAPMNTPAPPPATNG
jgi:hypothetical protein